MSAFGMQLAGRFSARAGRILVAGSGTRQRKDVRVALEFEGHEVEETETADRTLARRSFAGCCARLRRYRRPRSDELQDNHS